MTKIISPQSLVDRVPHHMKDLIPCHSVTTLEKDSDGTTSSKNKAESILLHNDEDMDSESLPKEVAKAKPALLAFTKKHP